MRKLWILVVFVLSNAISHSQDNVAIDSIHVTASQIPSLIKESGKSITIVTSEQIEKLPVSTVDELLRYVSGVNMNVRNQFGVQSDIGIRGSTFSQVLVLLDNVRINGPLTGHFNNNIPIAMAEIARIELIRGPASASFGADAVGGVIHIKSKTYVSEEYENSFSGVSGVVSAGSNELQSIDLGVFLKHKKWTFSASAKNNISEGELRWNPNYTAGFSPDSTYNNDFDIRTYSAAAAYRVNDQLSIYTRAGYDKRDFSAKYFYTRSGYDESRETVNNKWLQSTARLNGANSTNELTFGLAETDDLYSFNPVFTSNMHSTRQLSLGLTHNRSLGLKTKLAAGALWLQKSIESTDRGDHMNNNVGVFATASHFLTSDFKTTASVRVEHDENFGTEILPQLNVSYIKGKLTLRSSIGRSIRAGDFTERYVSNLLDNLAAGRNAGNPDLKAERAWSVDIGADYQWLHNTFISGSVFVRSSTNLIDFVLTNSNDIDNLSNLKEDSEYYYATNVSSTNTSGVELSVQNKLNFGQSFSLDSRLNATYLNTQSSDGEVSKYIANHPRLNMNLVLDLAYKNWKVNSSTFVINRDSEILESVLGEVKNNYLISNLKLEFALLSDSFSIFGEVRNIGNTEYQEILGAPLSRRWYIAGIRFNFK